MGKIAVLTINPIDCHVRQLIGMKVVHFGRNEFVFLGDGVEDTSKKIVDFLKTLQVVKPYKKVGGKPKMVHTINHFIEKLEGGLLSYMSVYERVEPPLMRITIFDESEIRE